MPNELAKQARIEDLAFEWGFRDVQWPMFVQFHFLKECPFTSLKVALINVVSIFQHVSILSLVSFVSSEWTIAFQLIYIHLNKVKLNFLILLHLNSASITVIHYTKISESENLNYIYVGEVPHLINAQQQTWYCL